MNEQAANIKFVQEIEKYPCLYNYELSDYSKKHVTEAAWNDVGKAMNMTGAVCKERWKNLRAVFVRNMKVPKTGSAAKRKKYYLIDYMQFALPFIKTLNVASSGNLTDTDDVQKKKEMTLVTVDKTDSAVPDLDNEENSTQQTAEMQRQPCLTEKPRVSSSKHKKLPLNEVDKTFVNYFKERQAVNNNADIRKMFLLSLLDEVHKMTEEQMRLFKRRVLTLIDDIMYPTATSGAQQPFGIPSPATSTSS